MRLRFWIRQGLEMAGITALVSFVYALLMSHEAEHSFTTRFIFLLLMMGAAIQMILPGINFKTNVSVTLSFGSTRREAFWGLQCYQLIQVGLLTALVGLLAMVTTDAELAVQAVVPLTLGAMLVFSALGTLLGMAAVQFGGKIAILISVILVLAAVGIMAVLFILSEGTLELAFGSWELLAAGAAAYLLVRIPEKRTLDSFCVKL